MRTLWTAILLLALLHVGGAAAFVGWLGATDRLSRDRLVVARQLFTKTIAQEQAERDAAAAQDAAQAENLKMLLTAGQAAPPSAAERIDADREQDEVALRKLERTREEVEQLRLNLHLAQQRVDRQRDDLIRQRDELQARIDAMRTQLDDEGFRKAVAMYDALPAKNVKQMFAELMDQQQSDQVVTYLESMQPRKAAAVLKEFKTPDEVKRAVELTEQLRRRGSSLVQQLEADS